MKTMPHLLTIDVLAMCNISMWSSITTPFWGWLDETIFESFLFELGSPVLLLSRDVLDKMILVVIENLIQDTFIKSLINLDTNLFVHS